jgi:hypothetical protein
MTAENFDDVSAAMKGILAGHQTNYSSSFSLTKMRDAPSNPH